jgi:hypothetical protein
MPRLRGKTLRGTELSGCQVANLSLMASSYIYQSLFHSPIKFGDVVLDVSQ